jgi:hypothetical protein
MGDVVLPEKAAGNQGRQLGYMYECMADWLLHVLTYGFCI